LEKEWAYKEILKRKWDSMIGVLFLFIVTMVSDFPDIGIHDWTNDAWYAPAAITRWSIVGILALTWFLIYSKTIDETQIEKFLKNDSNNKCAVFKINLTIIVYKLSVWLAMGHFLSFELIDPPDDN
jgi:hypothetical protein